MNYFRCTVGGSGKGNTVVVTCASEFAGQTITLSKTGKTYTKTCPSTAPYTVTYYGVEAGTYTVSATVSGQTYSETVIVQDVSCVLNYGFTWKTWVDTAQYLDSTDYASLSEVLADEEAVRELFTEHACVDYMADSTSSNADLETIIENDLCAKWINNSDYALDFLGANTVIKALMDTADKYGYGEWVITDDTTTPPTWGAKGNVPVMTANNAPYGTASASTEYSANYAAWKAFNGIENTQWSTSQNATSNCYLRYKFTNPVCVRRVKIGNSDSARAIKNFKVRYSNDGTNFTELPNTYTNSDVARANNYYDIDNNVYALYWDIYILNNYGDSYLYVRSLQFYGRELVETPNMYADTTDNGTCIASTQYDTSGTNNPYKAFDKDTSSLWASASTDKTNAWLGYKYKYAYQCNIFKLYSYSGRTMSTAYIEGSDDGETWTTLNGGTAINVSGAQGAYKYFYFTNTQKFKAYRLRTATQVSSSYNCNIYELAFFTKDYSEKEFEAGTTKKWLYDHGVELETLDATRGIVTKNADSITLKVTSSSAASIGKNIDLTPYSLMRAKVGGFTAAYNYLVVSSNLSSSTADASAQITSANAPNNSSLDVSAFNQTKAAFAQAQQVADATLELTEFWLE